MADPPIRRSVTSPPPIPARAPVAPSSAKTDVVPAEGTHDADPREEIARASERRIQELHEEMSEITRNLDADGLRRRVSVKVPSPSNGNGFLRFRR